VKPELLSLRADAAAVYADHRAAYLAQLVAPMDDMWAAFADMATPHALMVGEQAVGSCCVDEEGQLLRFYVRPRFQHHATALLRLALARVARRRREDDEDGHRPHREQRRRHQHLEQREATRAR